MPRKRSAQTSADVAGAPKSVTLLTARRAQLLLVRKSCLHSSIYFSSELRDDLGKRFGFSFPSHVWHRMSQVLACHLGRHTVVGRRKSFRIPVFDDELQILNRVRTLHPSSLQKFLPF